MAILDLSDLIPDLLVEVTVPGSTQYDSVDNDEWVSRLRAAFWDAHINGFMEGWEESDGLVYQLGNMNGPLMPRDRQQLIILHAGMNILRNSLLAVNTMNRYKAGSVEYETQKSAQTLRSLLDDMQRRFDLLLERLSDQGAFRGTFNINAYSARQRNIAEGVIDWIGSD